MSVEEKIENTVKESEIVIFMKGSPDFPQCGFSGRAIEILNLLGKPYEYFDVLADPDVRQGVKDYSGLPTIPQVFIKGEVVGGSDILMELYDTGELQKLIA
jgi:monothiol glutaredoxin